MVGDHDVESGSIRDQVTIDESLKGRMLTQGRHESCAKERIWVHDQNTRTARRNVAHEVLSLCGLWLNTVDDSFAYALADVHVTGLKLS